ncbi:MAG: hypothetical protein KJN67_01840 [Pontiella sp.]|nr:hypothetical protein [Pontiella sp.]MBT8045884.1 hypothetical protein [Pontiella sp.]NNJ70756.1 hypothetical protein [Kiritimatiellales bacterium]
MTRYEELLSLYLDGDPDEAELNELAGMLRDDSELADDFRQELLIWEAWSQAHAPERSADAFMAALHTRVRAQADAPEFELSVTEKLKKQKSPFLFRPLFAIAAAVVILLSLNVLFNPSGIDGGIVATAEAGPVHLHGECVCMRCTLQKEKRCGKAIRYRNEHGTITIIRLARDPGLRQYNKCFCKGPTDVVVDGRIVEENGEKILQATSLTIEE